MGCLVGLLFFAPGASRVSPRRASYFFLLRQKKVTKKKASHVRAASRCLALLAAFGTLANSLRSNSASVLIRTLLRCSARPNGGGYLTARPLRGPRPNGSLASLTSRSAGVASFLYPHFSQGHGTPCHYTNTPHSSRITSHHGQPQGLPLRPHSYDLTPHPSQRHGTPCPYTLTPHSSLLTPHPSLLRPQSSPLNPRLRTFHAPPDSAIAPAAVRLAQPGPAGCGAWPVLAKRPDHTDTPPGPDARP